MWLDKLASTSPPFGAGSSASPRGASRARPHDRTRPPGAPSYSTLTVGKVLALTCSELPNEIANWTGHAAATRIGISFRAVKRIWQEHCLQPHRVRIIKRSYDPAFVEMVKGVAGL